jgi:cytochrome c oxidase subunit 4
MTDHNDNHEGEQSHKSLYITIFLVLAFLTVVEVFIPTVYSSKYDATLKMLLLVMLAVGKATLVGCYFMHLKWEKPWLKYIAMMPAYMGLFAVLLMLETVYR